MKAFSARSSGAPAWTLLVGCASVIAACGRSPIRATPEAGASGGAGGFAATADGGGAGAAADAAPDTANPRDANPSDVKPAEAGPPDGSTADRPDGSADTRDAPDAFDGGLPDRPPPDTGNACPVDCVHLPHVLPGAMVPCRNNECVILPGVCESDWAHCRGSGNGGCESSLTTNTDCGSCNYSCFGPTAECKIIDGYHYCGQKCVMPYPDSCGFSCVDTQSDPSNCGACGLSCYQPNAQTACQAGKCVVIGCTSGYAQCDATIDGCETQLGTDDNCSACADKSCQLSNTLFACREGATRCDSALCVPGFANCDVTSADCEASFAVAAPCLPRYVDTLAIATGALDFDLAAIAADGSTFLAGDWYGSVDFDPSAGRDIRSAADTDSFVTKFNADGTYAWTAVLTGRGTSSVTGLAVTPSGGVVAAGSYNDSIDLDPSATNSQTKQTATPDQGDVYFVELTAAGQFAWGGSFQGAAFAASAYGAKVAVDAIGAVFLAGAFNGTFDFDPGPAVFSHSSPYDTGMLVKLSATGAFQSARFYDNGVCAASLSSVTVASDGNVWAVGTAGTGLDCPLDARDVFYSQASVLIVKHDAANTPAGKWLIGSTQSSLGTSVAAGRDGAVYVGGDTGPVDFDPGPGVVHRWVGTYAGGFILKLDASGAFRWVRTVVDGSVDALTATPDGGLIAIGSHDNPFLTRVTADGGGVWSFTMGGPGTGPQSLASNASRFVVAGVSSGSVDIDPGPGLDLIYGDITFVSRYLF